MATLYEALVSFRDIYDNAIARNSKREIEKIDQDWQTINNEMDCYYNAISTGDTTSAQGHIDKIVAILNGYELTVDLPIQFPLSLSVYGSPSSLIVPVDSNGLNPDYSGAVSEVFVYIGGLDDSANWTYSIASETNVTAVIQNGNEVKITALTADTGSVVVSIAKATYTTLSFTIYINRYYDAQKGLSINTYPSSIIIPSDSDGTNPVVTNAISTITAREGVDDTTTDWTFVIQAQTNVTAAIQNDNEVKINAISDEEGLVVVRGSHAVYDDADFNIPIQKQRKGQASLDGSSVDGVTLGVNTSDEGYVKRDAGAQSSIYGSVSDMVSVNHTEDGSGPSDFIFKSNILRNADTPGMKSIEDVNSVNGYTEGNSLIGCNNIIGFTVDDGYESESVYESGGSYYFYIKASEGDRTSYYTAGKKVIIYNDDDQLQTKYYISGTIVSSSHSGVTLVVYTPDFVFSDTINAFLNDGTAVSNGDVKATAFVPNPSGVGTNKVIGDRNKINGSGNYISGLANTIYGRNNYIYGTGWKTNSTGLIGNFLSGIYSPGGEVNGSYNVYTGICSIAVPFSNSASQFNVVHGTDNYVGNGTGTDGNSYNGNVISGFDNKSESNYSVMFAMQGAALANRSAVYGFGGESNTPGEIVSSCSNSPVQESKYILEGSTNSTSATTIQSLGRASGAGVVASNIQVKSNTTFSGKLTISASESAVSGFYRNTYYLDFTCDGSGNIINVVNMSDYTRTVNGTSGAVSFVTSTPNELIVQITAGSANSTKWNCLIEGVIMDV